MLPFGGITIETYPTKESKIRLRKTGLSDSKNELGYKLVVTGILKGDWPDKQQIDVVVVSDVNGLSYSGSGLTDNVGNFTIDIEDIPSGAGKIMIYYFGNNMAPSTLGPEKIKFL